MSSQQHEVLSDITLPHLTHLTSSPPPTPQWASTPRASLLLLRHASHAPSSCWRCPLARMFFDIPYGCSHTPFRSLLKCHLLSEAFPDLTN